MARSTNVRRHIRRTSTGKRSDVRQHNRSLNNSQRGIKEANQKLGFAAGMRIKEKQKASKSYHGTTCSRYDSDKAMNNEDIKNLRQVNIRNDMSFYLYGKHYSKLSLKRRNEVDDKLFAQSQYHKEVVTKLHKLGYRKRYDG